jgi:hypothetical protein
MINKKILISLFILISANVMLSYFHHLVLNIDLLQIKEASKTLTKTQINKILAQESNNEYLNFIIIPVSILIKIFTVSFVVYIGTFYLI